MHAFASIDSFRAYKAFFQNYSIKMERSSCFILRFLENFLFIKADQS